MRLATGAIDRVVLRVDAFLVFVSNRSLIQSL
jgi:hypothetical protein